MATKSSTFSSVISGSPMITSEKLVGSENYLSWSASVELWFMGQGYEDHLVTQEADIPEVDRVQWRKIDAQLCSVLWQSVDPKILLHLRAHKTCFKFWNQTKGLYTNDIQRLYKVASSIVNVRQQDMDLSTYIGQIASLKEEFLTVMPLTTDVGDQRTQIDKFFMVLTLMASVQISRPSAIRFLAVPPFHPWMISRRGRSGNRRRGQRPHCTYCNKLGHTRDRCYQLHGQPPRTAHVAQSSNPQSPQPPSFSTSQGISLTDSEYDDYLRYQATKSASVTYVAQTGNASTCLTHPSSLGPWILDSGASDHISGNKDIFSSITTTSALPTVTLANGSQTMAKGFGFTHPLPSRPLHSVLMPLSDRSTGKTIGIGRESQGLYHLTAPSTPAVCISTDAPLLIHNRLGHPSLSKFQKMVPSFSSLSSLACESCQLGKYTRVSFPKHLNNRAKSPFELIYIDVWGPCQTASTLGFQYFVTFIDDYFRCTCDNAREYFSTPFTSFMSQHGIIHQSSCAHAPQQNEGNAVLTACYLINRMPSSVLHDQIPHSLLFSDQPLYVIPPRVFCLYLLCSYSHSWIGQTFCQSHKMHLLGIFQTSKGYRCYSSETHRYFLSADVTFFEDSPFFSTSESLPVYEVLPLPIISPPDAVPSRPLQVYHRRHRVVVPPSLAKVPIDSLPIPSASPAPALSPSADLPIALRKGNRSTCNPHPIYNFLSYHRLSSPYSAFVSTISSVSLPKSTPEALSHPGWRQAMVDEMAALHSNGTWDLVVLPSGKSTVGCRWVYTVKVGPDGQVDRLKARLVAKGYTQVYGSDYGDTFSPVAKIASVRLLLSMAAMRSWPLYQLDIKNVFLHGHLAEEVYMEQPPGFVAQEESGLVCSTANHSVFYHHNFSGQCIYLIKDLGKLKYFLGIEIAQSSFDVVLSQRKYALNILEETGMLDCKPVDTPMDPNVKLIPGQGEPLGDPGRYRRLVGQGVLYENRGHTQVVGYTDVDWAGSPTDRRSTSEYCVFIGGNLISWKSKKQDVVARFSAEAEYRAMALATCELIWLKHFLQELRFGKDEQMKLIYDNQVALHIASNLVFHERTKHIEVDCHFIREKIASGCVATSFVNSMIN
ncbi:Retrovirus-related Pol polyprotein from transposon TNT 1-94 [Vitis vinifera]|uniref:Retrovirus-related Pol polyprotein from transposon TNT 1-94 n=1 Tax=Vitis vinifera TaxID=29760 RepID=A0A438CU93_VITVI|nr:Retrovirus-related Pol polyprotein from transposon TNT 1-94 [Vitis vinifera]